MQKSAASGVAEPQLAERHQASRLNSRLNGDQLPFADYVALNRDMITRVRASTGAGNLEQIVNSNAPFEMKPTTGYPPGREKPYKRGVLLTHGLTDSPYFMRPLAAFFQENGFRVMAVLLPGHGTRPGDLLDVSWKDWARAVEYGANQLAAEVDEVYLAGYSAGGALSIYHSLRDPRVCGLFLFSPALKITSRASWAKWHKIYSWLIPSAKWVNIKPDRDIYKYESFPKNAAAQMYALTQAVRCKLRHHPLPIPIFTAASQDDTTAQPAATVAFMAHTRHPSSKLVLYTTQPDRLPPNFPVEKLELVNSVLPSQKILGSAHTAILLPPEDAHYGTTGDYSNCVHYYPDDMAKYKSCNDRPTAVFQGEITDENLRLGTMRRLMVNPNFAALKISLKQFIEGLN